MDLGLGMAGAWGCLTKKGVVGLQSKIHVFVGTYTASIRFGTGQIFVGKGEGIYRFEFDPVAGKLNYQETLSEVVNPPYLVFSKERRCLYAVNELKEYQGEIGGSVSSFTVSGAGRLLLTSRQATGGGDPCHVELNPGQTHLYVSNFFGGSVAVFPLGADGAIGPRSQFIQHEGKSVDPKRQSGPHAHSLVFAPGGEYAFVPDLGLDKLMIYRTGADGSLTPGPIPHLTLPGGAGPRHLTFGPSGRYCYLINELDCTIAVLSYQADTGGFELLQSVSSLPEGVKQPGNTCADLHLTPDGAYLYGSNRGHNSLVIYRVDPACGRLSFVGCSESGGRTPRNFAIDPTGGFLLCANQDSDCIVVFAIDPHSGTLTAKSETAVPTPVCVRPYVW
jgi:6-phosphogluconolactonase